MNINKFACIMLLVIASLFGAACFSLLGNSHCSEIEAASPENGKWRFEQISGSISSRTVLYTVKDPDTNIEYIIVVREHAGVAITPRLTKEVVK